MIVYFAQVEEHTFDNRFDSYTHHRIFANRQDACDWADERAKKIAEEYDAEILDIYPNYVEGRETPFVWISVSEEEIY